MRNEKKNIEKYEKKQENNFFTRGKAKESKQARKIENLH